jgi:hypothetical protein
VRAYAFSFVLAPLLLALAAAGALAGTVRIAPRLELGIHTIHFEGDVVAGDLKRIRDIVSKARSLHPGDPLFVSWHSNGGHVHEAIEIGRFLRREGIGTVLLPDAMCNSACAFAFWGGFDRENRKVRRIVMGGARLGVHRFAFLREPKLPSGAPMDPNVLLEVLQVNLARTMDYLDEVEVSREIQRRQLATSHREIYVLKQRELEKSSVLIVMPTPSGWTVRNPETAAVFLPPAFRLNPASKEPGPEPQTAAAVSQDGPEPEDLRVSPLFPLEKVGHDATVLLPDGQSARGRWMYGMRHGSECLDVDVNPSQGFNPRLGFSVSLCFGKLMAGSMAYSQDIAYGPIAPKRASLILHGQEIEMLAVSQSSFIYRPLRLEWERLAQQSHFALAPSGEQKPGPEEFSAIRLVFGGSREIDITISLPEPVHASIRRALSVSRNDAAQDPLTTGSIRGTGAAPEPVDASSSP